MVYTLTTVYNFININNLDNLGYVLKIQDKVINKKYKTYRGKKQHSYKLKM